MSDNCEAFRKLVWVPPEKFTKEQRQAMVNHWSDCFHCQDWLAKENEGKPDLSPEEEEVIRALARESDEG